MNCGHKSAELAAYLADALSPGRRAAVDRRLAECPVCRAELAALARVDRLLAELPAGSPPDDLWSGVEARLAAPPGLWRPRLAWAGALAAALVAVWLTVRPPAESAAPYLRDHHLVAAASPLGQPAFGDVLGALAEEQR